MLQSMERMPDGGMIRRGVIRTNMNAPLTHAVNSIEEVNVPIGFVRCRSNYMMNAAGTQITYEIEDRPIYGGMS